MRLYFTLYPIRNNYQKVKDDVLSGFQSVIVPLIPSSKAVQDSNEYTKYTFFSSEIY